MESKTISIEQRVCTIHYLEAGSSKLSLIFIHGWCINSSYWEDAIRFFSKDYRVLALDLPGFGKSTATRDTWSIEAYGKDIIAFIDALKLTEVILVGHSMSGEISLEAALSKHSAIKGIIGVDNFKFVDSQLSPEVMEQMQTAFEWLKNDFHQAAIGFAENMLYQVNTPDSVKERLNSDLLKADPQIGFLTIDHLIRYDYGLSEKLSTLEMPLHLINIPMPPTNLTGLKNHCKKGFEIKTINATSHYPMIELPTQFNQLLNELLEKIQK